MAMNALREAAKESKFMKFILGGFIFLAVGGLVFTDINGYFRGGLPNSTVARVGEVEISIGEFDSGLRGFLQQTQMTAKDAYNAGLINAYLQNRIDGVLEAQATDDLNIRVGNKTIAGEVRKVFANATREEIESSLRARGISEGQMAAMIEDQIRTEIVTKLPKGVSDYIPAFLSTALNRANNEKRSGTLYTFPAAKLSDDITILDNDIESYYAANKARYAIPSKRSFTIGTLSVDDVAKSMPALSDKDLRAEYNSRINDFTSFETRNIEQIVVNDPDQAQKIYEMAMGGASLKDSATKSGADTKTFRASAPYEKNGLPDELSTVAFADDVKIGDALPPAKTLIGWHVMKVTAINAAKQTPFSAVKNDIKKTLAEESKFDALYDKITQTEDMIDSGDDFTKIVSETGLKTSQTKPVMQSDMSSLPQSLKDAISQNPSISQEIFSLTIGMASYPIETDDGGYMVVSVKSITPETFKPIDDVRTNITKILKSERIAQNASSVLDSVLSNLQTNSLTTKDMARQYGAQTKQFKNIGISSKKYDATLIFETPINGYNATITGDNQVQITTVNAIKRDDSINSKPSAEMAQIHESIFNAAENSYYRANTDVTVNQELLAAQYGEE